MRRAFLLGFCFFLCLPVLALEPPGGMLISEILTDPLGTDTGREFVELVNTSSQPMDISGWEMDADQLPYFVFPPGTVVQGHGTVLLQLRQQGTNSGTTLYTGAQFGSTNMGNTKGSVALFRPGGHDAAHLEDFVQWGEGNQTHSSSAVETGLFSASEFLPVPSEGLSFTRVCFEAAVSCFQSGTPSPGATVLLPEETSGSGTILETGTTMEETIPRLHLLYVAMNNPSGMSDDIGVVVTDDGNGGQGTVLTLEEVQVDTQKYALNGQFVRTGDRLHIHLATGLVRTTEAEVFLPWSQLAGLVATSEQVLLYDGHGELVDGVCWYKDPVAQLEVGEMEALQQALWQGDCLPSASLSTGAFFSRQDRESISAAAWTIVSLTPPPTHVPCSVPASITISEIFPNPDNADSGQEWIELHNTSTQKVSLCGLFLDDEEGGSPPFDLSSFSLEAGDFLLIPDTTSKLVLGNTADAVRLLNSAGEVVDEISYEEAPSGKSYSSI